MKRTLITISFVSILLFSVTCNKPENQETPVRIETMPVADSNVYYTSAVLSGNIAELGSRVFDEFGIIISKSPSFSDSLVFKNEGSDYFGKYTFVAENLLSGTTYFFKAFVGYSSKPQVVYANNTIQFTTKAINSPVVAMSDLTNITTSSVNANATVNDERGSPVIQKGFCWSKSASPQLSNCIDSVLCGTGAFSKKITSLEAGTTYYFRAFARNASGVGYSSDHVVTTLMLASAVTDSVTSITLHSASLYGTVNANNSVTTVYFDYGPGTSYGNSVQAVQSPLSGNTKQMVSVSISDLSGNLVYHFRVRAVSVAGTSNGIDRIFTTLSPPYATTIPVTNLLPTSATLNGIVNAKSSLTTVNFEYGTTTSYGNTIAATESPVNGTSDVAVSASLTGLIPGTTIHYRVVAVNSSGSTPGNDKSFTCPLLPVATTLAPYKVFRKRAIIQGIVNPNNSSTLVYIDYGLTSDYGTSTLITFSPLTGSSPLNVKGEIIYLTGGKTYHYRINAVSDAGHAYGEDMTFTTDTAVVKDIDGNEYGQVQIGMQTWMDENLKTTTFNDGTQISLVTDNASWTSLSTAAYCSYSNFSTTLSNFGALYNWYAASNSHLCPAGWHVPTDGEWTTLATFAGGQSQTGGKLKEMGIDHWNSPNLGASDEFGFGALPGGDRRLSDGSFELNRIYGFWWTSTEVNTSYSYWRGICSDFIYILKDYFDKRTGLSVRCIKD